MPPTLARTNDQWRAELRSSQRDEVLGDLTVLLTRGLSYSLAGYADVTEADIQDFVQDGLLKIMKGLDSYRGESQFLTWAQKIAVRVAFSELRRRRWRDVSLDALTEGAEGGEFIPASLADPKDGPDKQVIQSMMLQGLRRIIVEELTDRQREAMVAVHLHGAPVEVVAERMGTNRNALYKLIHDARQRLKKRMAAEGLSPQEVLNAFE